jgi:hypothetical protein
MTTIEKMVKDLEHQNKLWSGAYDFTFSEIVMLEDYFVKKLVNNKLSENDRERIANFITIVCELNKNN